jgi:hypothetical protein
MSQLIHDLLGVHFLLEELTDQACTALSFLSQSLTQFRRDVKSVKQCA